MGHNGYKVILTNGVVEHSYFIVAFSKKEAVILAQANAINQARGYDLVSCEQIENYCYSCGR